MKSPVLALTILIAATGGMYALAAPAPVILISIDTLRADHLGAYGYRKIRTPHLDSFAARGTLFTDISAQIPLTLPSHTSLLTSTYPFENRIEENAERVRPGIVTLASVLQAHGYRTAAFVGSAMLDRRLGLDRGFEFYDSPFNAPTDRLENPYAMRVRRDGALVVRAAEQWLRAHKGQRVFVFVHLFDLHSPYVLPPAFSHTAGITGYDAALEYEDHVIGDFQKELASDGWWDRALVVLLSDHGESLGDHGESSHGYFVYQSTLHVPLVFHWPAHWPSDTHDYPARMIAPAGLIDVAPTILAFLGIDAPASFEGESLLGAPRPHPVYSESLYTHDAFGWSGLRALRLGQYKYIEAPKPELYDLERDPREQTNLFRTSPEEAGTLRRRLGELFARYTAQPETSGNLSRRTRELLGSLGYIGSGPHAGAASSGRDPKDALPEYNLYEKGLAALYNRRPGTAIALFHRVLLLDPKNEPARCNLGDAYLRLHKANDALQQWNAVLARDAGYAPAADAIAEVWFARGNYSKARLYFARAATAAPGDYEAQFGLGVADERLGSTQEALVHFQAACRLEPDSAACREVGAAPRSK